MRCKLLVIYRTSKVNGFHAFYLSGYFVFFVRGVNVMLVRLASMFCYKTECGQCARYNLQAWLVCFYPCFFTILNYFVLVFENDYLVCTCH